MCVFFVRHRVVRINDSMAYSRSNPIFNDIVAELVHFSRHLTWDEAYSASFSARRAAASTNTTFVKMNWKFVFKLPI